MSETAFCLVIDSDMYGRREIYFSTEAEARDAWQRRRRSRDTYSVTLWRGTFKVLDFDRGAIPHDAETAEKGDVG